MRACAPCVCARCLPKRRLSTLKNGSTTRASGASSARIPCVVCVRPATVARRARLPSPCVQSAVPPAIMCLLQKSKCARRQCATARPITPRGRCASTAGLKKTQSRAAARGASVGPGPCVVPTGCAKTVRAVSRGVRTQSNGRCMGCLTCFGKLTTTCFPHHHHRSAPPSRVAAPPGAPRP